MGLHIGFRYRVGNIHCVDTPGRRIQTLRKAKQLNQTQLGEAVGVDQSTISDIENDRTKEWSARILMGLSDALGAPPEQIMRGTSAAWPFPRVAIERFLRLSHDDRVFVEGKLEAAIESRESATSHSDESPTHPQTAKENSGTKDAATGRKTSGLINLREASKRAASSKSVGVSKPRRGRNP